MALRNRWHTEVAAAANGVSEPVFFPRRVSAVTVKAIPSSGGGATIKFTLDDPQAVAANPESANWESWDPGVVAEATSRALAGPVTALRLEAVGEPAVMQVAGTFDF